MSTAAKEHHTIITGHVTFQLLPINARLFYINLPHMGLTVDSSQLTFLPGRFSKSRDTESRTNIKSPAQANLDIVP